MSDAKRLIAAIIRFLEDERSSGQLSEDAQESLEVASQCLESAYEVTSADAEGGNLLQIFTAACPATQRTSVPPTRSAPPTTGVPPSTAASAQDKEEADKKKAEGNELMKQEKYEEAIKCYSQSIELDGSNAVYYCNRAAALIKINENEKALEDCKIALQIDPDYSKAHGRKGLAHTALNQHREARDSFQRAFQLDPTNLSYQNNLEVAEQKIREMGGEGAAGGFGGMGGMGGGMDFSALFSNPALMNMATNMMANPQMQQMMSNLMSGANSSQEGQAGIGNLLQVGQQMAQQMQQNNPELVSQLRNQMRGQGENPDGGSA